MLNPSTLTFASCTINFWEPLFDFLRYSRFSPRLVQNLQRPQQKSESWNEPNWQWWALFTTWQCCWWSFVWEYQVDQFWKSKSMFKTLWEHLWTVHQPFPILPPWCCGCPSKELRLHSTALFVRAISQCVFYALFRMTSQKFLSCSCSNSWFGHLSAFISGIFVRFPFTLSTSQVFVTDDAEARADVWSIQVTSSIVITMNLEFNSTCRRKKHSLYHWSALVQQGPLMLIWSCYKRRGIDDYWNVDSSKNLSDSRKGSTKFTLLKDKVPKGYMRSGRWTDKSSNDFQVVWI